jgi:hypothetical protein
LRVVRERRQCGKRHRAGDGALSALLGQALGFDPLGFGLLGRDAFLLQTLGFEFRGQALGFRLLGSGLPGRTLLFGALLRFDRGLFRREPFLFQALGFGALGRDTLPLDALGFGAFLGEALLFGAALGFGLRGALGFQTLRLRFGGGAFVLNPRLFGGPRRIGLRGFAG